MNTKPLFANLLTLRSRTGLLMLAAAMLAALPAPWLPAAKSAAPGKTQRLDSPDQTPEGLSKSDWTSIRAAYEAGRHAFMPIEGGWQARNPGQQWTTKFDGRGFLATPREGAWTWGLELRSYGFGEKQTPVGVRAPQVKAEGQRLTYQWNATVQEWWVNDRRGLEHGYVIHQRPPEPRSSGRESAPSELGEKSEPTHVGCYSSGRESSLSFVLATRGNLKPRVSPDGLAVLFQDATGATVLNYTGLKVWDADGKTLPSRFEIDGSQPSTLSSQPAVRLVVPEQGARYPITIDPIAQQAYLKSGNNGGPLSDDQFGWSVAVSGDTVVVGAPKEGSSTTGVNSTPNEGANDAGAAYVFVRSGTTWSQQAYLKAHQVTADDSFGSSVAVSGDTVVVGAWGEDSGTTGVNSAPNESAFDAGAAYVFVRSGGMWRQQAYLKAHQVTAVDWFGYSVTVSGDTVVIGAIFESSSTTGVNSTPDESASASGAAYVFTGLGPALPPRLSIVASGPARFNLSWAPPTSGFALQESLSLSAVGWSNSPSGATNPITLPAAGSAKFFRLFKP